MDPYGDTGFGRVRVSRSVVNMFENAQMRRILNHSLGLEYDYELSGDDEETWVQHQIDMANLTSCGYGHGPHGHHGPRSSSFTYRQPQRSTASTCCPSPVKVPPGDSDSERKTRLLQESKKEKERAERKKKKKMKQKERKRREKLKKENKVTGKKEEEGDDDDDDAERSEPEECERDKSEEGAKGEASEDQESKSEVESSNEDNDSCASEELDMSSSFVSKAALIAKRQLDQKAKAMKVEKVSEKECKISVEKPDEAQQADNKELVASSSPSFEDVIKISTDLAVIGNKYASAGDFVTAVRYFTDAIKYNPTEFKLFGNRSLCFEKMQEYEKALADAELSLGIRPGWVKGLFRKGKALAGLKRSMMYRSTAASGN
ncbi:tetratricopeptide repeat protein 31-like [Gouania willdenowi]|uniref:tetratricopeptide repeat protein 31-like n=1 Tax=Gouania willdenowi TaxID=441366 RepID=UPI00105667A9|nr:tetratricopeptide repeat protein 31-like [Gouania willdenowi]